ncbi:unnamed protein product [Ixodes pacificus]
MHVSSPGRPALVAARAAGKAAARREARPPGGCGAHLIVRGAAGIHWQSAASRGASDMQARLRRRGAGPPGVVVRCPDPGPPPPIASGVGTPRGCQRVGRRSPTGSGRTLENGSSAPPLGATHALSCGHGGRASAAAGARPREAPSSALRRLARVERTRTPEYEWPCRRAAGKR